MNGLSTIVDALLHAPRRRPVAAVTGGPGKTGALRDLLRAGPADCADLSERSGMPRTLVSALLHHDVRRGRVRVTDGTYRLEPEFNEDEPAWIRGAITLLRARGYTVEKP